MLLVVGYLLGAAALGLTYGLFHGRGDVVCVHDNQAVDVACCAAGGLREGTPRAEEAFLVCIQDGHQRHCGDVKSLAEQVYAHKDVEQAVLEVFYDFYALGGIYV